MPQELLRFVVGRLHAFHINECPQGLLQLENLLGHARRLLLGPLRCLSLPNSPLTTSLPRLVAIRNTATSELTTSHSHARRACPSSLPSLQLVSSLLTFCWSRMKRSASCTGAASA